MKKYGGCCEMTNTTNTPTAIRDYEKQISIAKTAQTTLSEYREEAPDMYAKFAKLFHLRPCSKDITIVTTHPCRPMRGITVCGSKLKNALAFIASCIGDDGKTVDWAALEKRYNTGKGFVKGFTNREFPHQANMINHMCDNKELKKLLGVQNLYFTASEVIFSRGLLGQKKKIDVVGHDDAGKVFFFEMKAPENERDNPIEQVQSYLELYGKNGGKKGAKNEVFEKMMANYPQNPITRINEYIGYGIVGYSENIVLEKKMLIVCK
jgi:hypothetical protein